MNLPTQGSPPTHELPTCVGSYSPESMRANNVIGEAPEVIERLKRYQAMGYDEYALWIDSGMSYRVFSITRNKRTESSAKTTTKS